MIATFDGGCLHKVLGAGAAVLYTDDYVEIARKATYMEGPLSTTNVAEYLGLVNALSLAVEHNATAIRIFGDSELIVHQFSGQYQCRGGHLKPWLQQARHLATLLPECSVDLLPKAGPQNRRRFGNVDADALATACMKARRDLP